MSILLSQKSNITDLVSKHNCFCLHFACDGFANSCVTGFLWSKKNSENFIPLIPPSSKSIVSKNRVSVTLKRNTICLLHFCCPASCTEVFLLGSLPLFSPAYSQWAEDLHKLGAPNSQALHIVPYTTTCKVEFEP